MRVKYYITSSGRSPVEEFLNHLSENIRSDFVDALLLLESGQNLTMPLSRPLFKISRGLHELRLKDRYGTYRVFYFIKRGDAIYLVHAFAKKTQELSHKEIELVKKRLREI
ncbi:MAG: type II toxin-antitoxin system RelE/ParE family toxin [Bdellovibrionaceae bacterium]|nr:type II toxin-antitoxin system RelE/ParE family toxin [Pseudobdellovibrionaceae bacterium]